MRWVVGLLLAALLPVSLAPAASAAPRKEVVPCSRGLVALTFDDGPSATITPQLVRLLTRLEVPATFFMVGSRVASAPDTARLVERAGFAIGNHTWAHTDLTTQTRAEIRHALRSTHRELVAAGLHPTDLVRPPYGAVNDRVRRVLAELGYADPVLWTIDSRDWTGESPREIGTKVLSAVQPHRANVVLQHDGVTNSPATLRALPREIATLRERGYCFAALDADGNPTPPVPVPAISTDVRRVDEGGRVLVTVRLDRPTSRPTVVRVQGLGSHAVRFPVGDTVARLRLTVPHDPVDEAPERLVLSAGEASAAVVVRDLDAPPRVRVTSTTVTASPILATSASIGVRLDHRSGREVSVLLRGPGGRRWVSVPAGELTAELPVTVRPGTPAQPVRRLPVEIVRAQHATPGSPGEVTVRPPAQTRPEAARAAAASIRWPVVRVPSFF